MGTTAWFLALEVACPPLVSRVYLFKRLGKCSTTEFYLQPPIITQNGTNKDRDKDYLEMTVLDHPMSRSILKQILYLLATSFIAIYGLELI